jgi:carboxypeptidase Q
MPHGRVTLRRLFAASIACIALSTISSIAQEAASKPEAAVELDKKIFAAAAKDSEIMKNLGYLSDRIGPRLTGSDSLRRANEWAAEVMKSYGLENVHQEGWQVPTGWERGTATAKIIEPSNGQSILIASRGWSPSTKGKIVGEVVLFDAKSSQDLDKYRGKLENAFIMRGPPSQNVAVVPDLSAPQRGGFGGGGPPRRGEGPAAAEKDDKNTQRAKEDIKKLEVDEKGAAGKPPAADNQRPGRRGNFDPETFSRMRQFQNEVDQFLRAEGAAASFSDAGKPQGLLVTTGSWRGQDRVSAPEPLPGAFISHEHYSMLYRMAKTGPVKLEVEITNKFIPGPITCYNTVGEIKGSKKPDEFVVVGAHIDSWDLASGTTDNGTGTCIVLETARILKKLGIKPDRTIRFCLFSGEEQGLHGSAAYVKQHESELPKMSMCLVHDTGTGKVQGIALSGFEAVKPILERELTSLKPLGVTNISNGGLSAGGSDHASFSRVGVPGFAVIQDMREYTFTHHTQSDTLDKVHEENLIQGAQVLAVSAVRVANLEKLLPRDRPASPRGFGGGRRGNPDGGKKDAPEKKESAPKKEGVKASP